MSVATLNSISADTSLAPTNASGVSASVTDTTDPKSQFLQLLVTQLQNQDPTAPTDQTQMLAQLAQFSSLEQMQNLNTTMTGASSVQQLGQGAALIGKTVNTVASDGSAGPSGVVTSVIMKSGAAYLHIGDQDVTMSSVSSVN